MAEQATPATDLLSTSFSHLHIPLSSHSAPPGMTVPVPAVHPQPNPPTPEILATHTLAARTILQHATPTAVFDRANLDFLKAWVGEDTPRGRQRLLEERGYLDGPEEELGSAARRKGDLLGMVLARYGCEGDVMTFTAAEVEELRKWFELGGGVGGEEFD